MQRTFPLPPQSLQTPNTLCPDPAHAPHRSTPLPLHRKQGSNPATMSRFFNSLMGKWRMVLAPQNLAGFHAAMRRLL
jgi:hypothetical protein